MVVVDDVVDAVAIAVAVAVAIAVAVAVAVAAFPKSFNCFQVPRGKFSFLQSPI